MPTAVISSPPLSSPAAPRTPGTRPTVTPFADADVALVMLGHELRMKGYGFTAVPRKTQVRRRAVVGPDAIASSLRDIFGFNLPFSRAAFPTIAEHLDAAGMSIAVARRNDDGDDVDLVRSAVRFTTHGSEIVAHNAYPIFSADDVIVAADVDSSRFCRLLQQRVTVSAARVLSLAAGSGAAALHVGAAVERLVLVDSRADALRLARVNLALAGISPDVDVEFVNEHSNSCTTGEVFDLIIIDAQATSDHDESTAAAVRLVEQALTKLAPGGRLIMSTTTPVVAGIDRFRAALTPVLAGRVVVYDELEADVLDASGVVDHDVERVAVVVLEVSAARLQAVTADDFDFDGDVL